MTYYDPRSRKADLSDASYMISHPREITFGTPAWNEVEEDRARRREIPGRFRHYYTGLWFWSWP